MNDYSERYYDQKYDEFRRNTFLEKPPTVQEFLRQYMDLYRRGQELFTKYNPCQGVIGGACKYSQEPERCCRGCKYHSQEKGCTTISLSCKLWFCNASDVDEAFYGELKLLREERDKMYVRDFPRMSLAEAIRSLREKLAWRHEIWRRLHIEGEEYHGLSIPKARKSVSRAA